MGNEEKIKERFKALYPDKRLLAYKLDGFSHVVWFDNGSKNSPIEQNNYSGYMPERKTSYFNNDKVRTLFAGFPHHSYQGNPEQCAFITPEER